MKQTLETCEQLYLNSFNELIQRRRKKQTKTEPHNGHSLLPNLKSLFLCSLISIEMVFIVSYVVFSQSLLPANYFCNVHWTELSWHLLKLYTTSRLLFCFWQIKKMTITSSFSLSSVHFRFLSLNCSSSQFLCAVSRRFHDFFHYVFFSAVLHSIFKNGFHQISLHSNSLCVKHKTELRSLFLGFLFDFILA